MKKIILAIVVVVIVSVGIWALWPKATTGGFLKCEESQRNADFCTADYTPVCATVEIQCIKAPCYPIQQTFSNVCNACKNPLVKSYIAGACQI